MGQLMHYKTYDNDYLCTAILKANPNKMTVNISDVNCSACLTLISENKIQLEDLHNRNKNRNPKIKQMSLLDVV